MNQPPTVQQQLQEDPDLNIAQVRLRWELSDADLAETIQKIRSLARIYIILDSDQLEREWPCLLQVLETKKISRGFLLASEGQPKEGRPPPAVGRLWLQAIARNRSVKTVAFQDVRFSADAERCNISFFLDSSPHITHLSIRGGCDFAPEERDRGASELAEALERHPNIKLLQLYDLDEIYIAPILQGLSRNVMVKSLSVEVKRNQNRALYATVAQLLSNHTSIKSIELKNFRYNYARFKSLSQSLSRNKRLNSIGFVHCHFLSDRSRSLLSRLIRKKSNLTALDLRMCHGLSASVFRRVTSKLQKLDGSLRSLRMHVPSSEDFVRRDAFRSLLEAVAQSRLQSLFLSTQYDQQQLEPVISCIPAMKNLKELELDLGSYDSDEIDTAPMDRDLLLAVKRNFSLRSFNAYGVDATTRVRKDIERAQVDFILNRNLRLAKWVENPELVPPLLWPEALGLALAAGKDDLYRSLLALSGHGVGLKRGSQKRKRLASF